MPPGLGVSQHRLPQRYGLSRKQIVNFGVAEDQQGQDRRCRSGTNDSAKEQAQEAKGSGEGVQCSRDRSSISLAPGVAHVEQPFELPAQSLKSCDDPGALDLVDELSSFNIDHDVPDPRSKQVFSCVNLMHSFCKSAVSAPTALGSFIRQSLKLADHACTMEKAQPGFMACPPPGGVGQLHEI